MLSVSKCFQGGIETTCVRYLVVVETLSSGVFLFQLATKEAWKNSLD